MRYYCKNCETEFNFWPWVHVGREKCPVCVGTMIRIPDFETPEQYEKRTGKELSDHAVVWIKQKDIPQRRYTAFYWHKDDAKDISYIVVCPNGPEPPPVDWRPEEEDEQNKD